MPSLEIAARRALRNQRRTRAEKRLAAGTLRRLPVVPVIVVGEPPPLRLLLKKARQLARFFYTWKARRPPVGGLLIGAFNEGEWNLLMDMLPRCECGRPVFPPRLKFRNNRSRRVACSPECYHRYNIREAAALRRRRERERAAFAYYIEEGAPM